MATIVTRNGREEWPDNDPRVMAESALARAAERMAAAGFRQQLEAHLKRGRKRSTFRPNPSQALRDVCAARSKVLGGEITPEQAMALLWQHDTFRERLAV